MTGPGSWIPVLASAPDHVTPDEIVRSYLTETLRMIQSSDLFEVLAHIDDPVRGWPAAAETFDPAKFEDEYRAVLRALAGLAACWRSTPACRCRPRSSAGGTPPAARRSFRQ